MEKRFTRDRVEELVRGWCEEIRDQFGPSASDREQCEADRETVMEWAEECHDGSWWGQLCTQGRLTDWDLDDLLQNMKDGSIPSILELAEECRCVETDSGLWDGCQPWAAVGIVAFYSLRNLIWHYMEDEFGMDINSDHPCKPEWWDKVSGLDRKGLLAALEIKRSTKTDEELLKRLIDEIQAGKTDPEFMAEPD